MSSRDAQIGAGSLSLTLIPPSPITTQVTLDVRLALRNPSAQVLTGEVEFRLCSGSGERVLRSQPVSLQPGACEGVAFRWPSALSAGNHRLAAVLRASGAETRVEKPLEILDSPARSTGRLGGAWNSIVHWSPIESQLWQEELRTMTDEQWREQVRAMHRIGLDVIVIQEVFRNQAYVGDHFIEREGYQGRAFYPSELFPGRVELAAHDPIEAILSQADELGMMVFPGVGLYAWFDFTPGSLAWHEAVADELWRRYGRHPSFYGWYVSEEVHGVLHTNMLHDRCDAETYRRQIVEFFRRFKVHCRRLSPDKPVMLAPNCHGLAESSRAWAQLLEHIDILCPFGFHRMPPGDMTGPEAALLLQGLCDRAGAHLWMDMEAFLFAPDGALVPRPIEGVIDDLKRFAMFEKVLCYQYPGLMNAPGSSIMPGGPATVQLYTDYQLRVLGR